MSLAVPSIIGNKNIMYPYPGGTVQWANLFNNLSPYVFDGGNAIALDSEQNVYVAGFTGRLRENTISNNISGGTIYIRGTTQDLSAQRPPFRSTGAILIKYTTDGNPQWCRFVDYSGNVNISGQTSNTLVSNFREEIGLGLTIDSSNNIYMCGQHYGNNITFSTDTISTPFFIDISNINRDISCTRNGFIAKYNSAGNFQWGHICAPISISGAPKIDYNAISYYNNNIYIGGVVNRSVSNNNTAIFYSIDNNNIIIKKENFNIGGGGFSIPCIISMSSTNGAYNWHRYIVNENTNGIDRINTIAVNNNIIYFGADFFVDMCGTTNITEKTVLFSGTGINTSSTGPNNIVVTYKSTTTRNSSIVIGKYDLNGTAISGTYIDSFNGTDYNKIDRIQKIIFDNSNNLIIAGTSTGYNIDLSDLSYSRPNLTSSNIKMDEAIFIAKYDTSLNPIKARIIDTYRRNLSTDVYTSDMARSIAVDSRNNIYVAGVLTDSSDNTQFVRIDNAIIDRYNAGGRSYGALLQLNSDLSAQWGIAIDNTFVNYRYEEIRDIVIDKYDNIYITGYGPGYDNLNNSSSNSYNTSLQFGKDISNNTVIRSMGTINGFNYDICGYSGSHGFVAKYSPGYINIVPEQDGEQINMKYFHTKNYRNNIKYDFINPSNNIDISFSNKGIIDISYIPETQPANSTQYYVELKGAKTNRNQIIQSRPFTYNPIPAIQLAPYVTMTTTIDGITSLNGIAVDSKGYIYVCDVSQHCVRRFNPTFNDTSGVVVAGIAGDASLSGSDLSRLLNPIQIVIDTYDNLYILDTYYGTDNIRIIKWNTNPLLNINILSTYYDNTSNKLESKYMYINKNKEHIIFSYIYYDKNYDNNTSRTYIKLIKYNVLDNSLFLIHEFLGYDFFYDTVVVTNNLNNVDISYSIFNIKMLIINEIPVIYPYVNNYLIHVINNYNYIITLYSSSYLNRPYEVFGGLTRIQYNNSIFNINSIIQNSVTNENYSIIIPNNNKLQTFIVRTQAVSDYFTLPGNNKFNSIANDPSDNIYAIYNNNSILIKPQIVKLWVDISYNIAEQNIILEWNLIGNQQNSNIYYNIYKYNDSLKTYILIRKNISDKIFIENVKQELYSFTNKYKIETLNKYNGNKISNIITILIPNKEPTLTFIPNPITLKSNSHISYNPITISYDISQELLYEPISTSITLQNIYGTYISNIELNENNQIIINNLGYNDEFKLEINSNITLNNIGMQIYTINTTTYIFLPKTGMLTTPIIGTIEPSYNTCRIYLQGFQLDSKSINDLSYIKFNNDGETNDKYLLKQSGSTYYVDIINLETNTSYNNVSLVLYYNSIPDSKSNIIETDTFNFNTLNVNPTIRINRINNKLDYGNYVELYYTINNVLLNDISDNVYINIKINGEENMDNSYLDTYNDSNTILLGSINLQSLNVNTMQLKLIKYNNENNQIITVSSIYSNIVSNLNFNEPFDITI
jgi:hypothetical protein